MQFDGTLSLARRGGRAVHSLTRIFARAPGARKVWVGRRSTGRWRRPGPGGGGCPPPFLRLHSSLDKSAHSYTFVYGAETGAGSVVIPHQLRGPRGVPKGGEHCFTGVTETPQHTSTALHGTMEERWCAGARAGDGLLHGMAWNDMAWNGMAWNRMVWKSNGVEWKRGMECGGMEWRGMKRRVRQPGVWQRVATRSWASSGRNRGACAGARQGPPPGSGGGGEQFQVPSTWPYAWVRRGASVDRLDSYLSVEVLARVQRTPPHPTPGVTAHTRATPAGMARGWRHARATPA
eukprot:gene24292-biopygen1350